MQQSLVLEQLKTFIAKHTLDGKDIGLDEYTPLLEWGIINSMEIIRLMSFIKTTLHVEVSADKIVAENFTTLSAITDMVLESSIKQNG